MAPSESQPLNPIFNHGLVIGKFYPPHRGHVLLIETAAQFCKTLSVGIFDAPNHLLPLVLRQAAFETVFTDYPHIRFTHAPDTVPVDYDDPDIWSQHVAIFKSGIDHLLTAQGTSLKQLPVDAVFTSEVYGDELARRLNCKHIAVDPPRSTVPISATLLRQSPIEHWHMTLPTIQQHLCKRIVVVGAESTGTTTLARDLRDFFSQQHPNMATTRYVPEYGRNYAAIKLAIAQATHAQGNKPWLDALTWNTAEFEHIAQQQTRWENEATKTTGPVLICDTDALATAIWHERYCGHWPISLEPLINQLVPRTLYILTDDADVPFEQDGLRDGEHLRQWMTQRFTEELQQRRLPHITVYGDRNTRLQHAISAIQPLLHWNWR